MIKRLIKDIDEKNRKIFIMILLGLCYSAASVLTAAALGNLTEIAGSVVENEVIMKHILLVALTFLVEFGLSFIYRYMRRKSMACINHQLNMQYANAICNAKISWIQDKNSGDILGRLQKDITEVSSFYSETFQEIILQSIRIVLFGLVMFVVNWKLSLLYYGIAIIIVLIQIGISKPIQKYALIKQESYGNINAFAQDVLNNHKTIKMFNSQPLISRWYNNKLDIFFKASIRCELFTSPIRALGWLCGLLPILVLCVVGALLINDGFISLGNFMILYFLADASLNDMMHYGNLFSGYRVAKASINRVYEIFDAPQEEVSWKSLKIDKVKNQNHLLSFYNVSFAYASKDILKDIFLNIDKGEKIAIVGRSGCGKSTLLKLIIGFMEPQKGMISFKGKAYSKMSLYELRQDISYVPQDSFLFPWTIEENICPKGILDMGKFLSICDKAQVNAFVEDLPDQYNTNVGERGTALSGGQIQRIALARALMKDTSLLLLDEATSALDVNTEKKVQKALNELPCTVITAAHRLSAIQDSDRIYVMDSGRIAEQGTHMELLSQNGIYFELFSEQHSKEGAGRE